MDVAYQYPTAWELDLGAARFTLLLGVLLALEPTVGVARLAEKSGFSSERTVASLSRLAAAGRVGYDLAEGAGR
jgi:hypothetical protein